MVAKITRFAPAVCAVLIIQLTCLSCANIPARLEQAETLMKNVQYEQAEAIYKQIVTDYPGTDYALTAQKRLVKLYISVKRDNDAQAAIDNLITDFSGDPKLPKALWRFTRIYKKAQKYRQLENLYNAVITTYPGTDDALRAQKYLIVLYITTDDQLQAQAALQKRLTDFAAHERLSYTIRYIARQCIKLEKAEQAEQLFQSVLADQPNSDQAIWLHMGIAVVNAFIEDDAGAEAAIQKLISQFSDDSRSAEAVRQIAWSYLKIREYEKALPLYQHILDNWAEHEYAIWAQRGVILGHIALGDDLAAEAGIKKLLTDFSGHNDIPKVVNKTADQCRRLKEYDKALQLYQYVVDNYPDDDLVIWSLVSIAGINVSVGDDDAAESVLDKLIDDFADHPALPRAICIIEEGYYMRILAAESWVRENYLRPVEMWEKVLSKFPDFFHPDPDLYYFIACCYYQLGQYEKAIYYYSMVVDNWPDHRHALGAQRIIETCFERLTNAGK